MLIRATTGSNGWDLFSVEDVEIRPSTVQKMTTDIGLKIPKNHHGRICKLLSCHVGVPEWIYTL